MPVIALITKASVPLENREVIYDNGNFFLGANNNPSAWKAITLEQINQLDSNNYLKWNNENHRIQILNHYRTLNGLPLIEEKAITATVVNRRSSIMPVIKQVFSNRFLALGIMVIFFVGIIVLGIMGSKYVFYSDSVNTGDVENVLEKEAEAGSRSSEYFLKFQAVYGYNNVEEVRQEAFGNMASKVVSEYQNVIDVEQYVSRILEEPEYQKSWDTTGTITIAEQVKLELKNLEEKNQYGLKGNSRLLGALLFIDSPDYKDEVLKESLALNILLHDMSSELDQLSVANKFLDVNNINTASNEGVFTVEFILPETDEENPTTNLDTNKINFEITVDKSRKFGSRIVFLRILDEAAAVEEAD